MHNMVWYVCGQYVYNLRKGVGTTCQYSSTVCSQLVAVAQSLCAHHRLIRTLLHTIPLPHSTPKRSYPYLLQLSYTHFPHPLLLPQPNEI